MEGTTSSSEAIIPGQVATRSDYARHCDFLNKLSAEIRVKIYELVLPVDAFYSRRYPTSAGKVSLLSTCKLINQESYPVYVSLNNFDIDYSLPFYYHPTHDFYKHARQLSFEWMPKTDYDEDAREVGKNNYTMIKHLYEFPKLRILHISSFWDVDREYQRLQDHYKEEGVVQSYLEDSGLKAFLRIPGIEKITFSHNRLSEVRTSEGLAALEKYVTKQLEKFKKEQAGQSKSALLEDSVLWKEQVLSCLTSVFGGEADEYRENETPQRVWYCKEE